MAANYLKKFRKSYFGDLLLSAILSNIIIFGQPIHQLLSRQTVIKNQHHAETSFKEEVHTSEKQYHVKKNTLTDVISKMDVSSYPAYETSGIIGKTSDSDSENPSDNFFSILLPDDLNMEMYDAVLLYDLYGLTSASETTKSINNGSSYGGKMINKSEKWISVKEQLPASQLKSGNNDIFFNRRTEENYQYKVKNLSIKLQEKKGLDVIISKNLVNKYGKVYVVGTAPKDVSLVTIEEQEVAVVNGVFEHIISNVSKDRKDIKISYAAGNNFKKIIFPIIYQDGEYSGEFSQSAMANLKKTFDSDALFSKTASYDALRIKTLKALTSDKLGTISVTGLDFKDVRILNAEVENVTAGNFPGYRVNIPAISDSVSVQLALKYDAIKIPEGYTEQDIKTFYFDKSARTWKELAVDSLDTEKKEILSTTLNEGTDYINGVIKVPDSPETGSFAPTAMNDIKYADPAAGVVSISPPSPNNSGNVNTSFPLKLPPGRNGMSPSLAISYNSEACNGWMGIGWNLSTQAITLNTTWGAPLYDHNNETELYSMNGSDLVLQVGSVYTNPHRDANILRNPATDRVFFERREGSYNNIVRHGNAPTNYWWEVTDKQGNKTFYGGIPGSGVVNRAVLKTASGQIGHWAITKSQDPFGNYIEYIYNVNKDTIIPGTSVPAKEFYLESIRYTMNGAAMQNYYQVDFKRNSYTVGNTGFTPRQDVTLNARNGYVQLTDKLLTEIHVSLVQSNSPALIRKYRFDYSDPSTSPFNKSQLQKISEFDKSDALFYSNTMEYYNDIGNSSIIPNVVKSWNSAGNEGISSFLSEIAGSNQNEIPTGSPLGTSTSYGGSFGARVGIGLGNDVKSIRFTVGGSYNYHKNNSETKVSFVDINGDGLPDKVYRDGNSISYRASFRSGTQTGFGDQLIPISGLSALSKTISTTNSYGADFSLLGNYGIGASKSTTKSETSDYFTDFNGDGLPDVMAGNTIKFNKSTSDPMQRNFSPEVIGSENVIEAGAINEDAIFPFLDFESMDELREQHPQFDHVKIWKAPYTGTVDISGMAVLKAKAPGSQENKFKLTIERASQNQLLNGAQVIEPPQSQFLNNIGQSVSMSYSNCPVIKGETYFFRIHNLNYGYGGEIEWNPKIIYHASQNWPVGQLDDNGKKYLEFDAKEDFLLNNGGAIYLGTAASSSTAHFNLEDFTNQHFPYDFSDDIQFVVRRTLTNVTDGSQSAPTEFSVTYKHDTNTFLQSPSTTAFLQGTTNNNLAISVDFFVECASNIDFSKINWKPTLIGGSVPNSSIDISHRTYDNNVNQSVQTVGPIPVNPIINGNDQNDPQKKLLVFSHTFFDQASWIGNNIAFEEFPIKVNWVVKERKGTQVATIASKTFYVHKTQSGSVTFSASTSPTPSLNLTLPANIDYTKIYRTKQQVKDVYDQNGTYYSAFYIDNEKLGTNNPASITLGIYSDEINNYPLYSKILSSPFMARSSYFFGMPYRGWGQMLYNGGLKFDRDANDEIVLNANSPKIFGGNAIDMGVFNINSQAQTISDPNFDPTTITADQASLRYMFYDQDNNNGIYKNTSVIESKFGKNQDGLLTAKLGRFAEPNLHELYVDPETITQVNPGVFVGLKQRSKSTGMSFNGSIYVLSQSESTGKSQILNQYMDLNGDRYPDIVTSGNVQYTNMRGALSSKFVNPEFTAGEESSDSNSGVNTGPTNSTGSNNTSSDNKTFTNIAAGINSGSGNSKNACQWADMNGDGLPDKVFINSTTVDVNLNTGYGFSPEIQWGNSFPELFTSKRTNAGLGLSSNIGGSFAAGFGMGKSTANISTVLLDVNGDQLTDLVIKTGNSYSYYLNTGKGFDTTQKSFFANPVIEQDYTVSGNIFGSFTYGFPAFSFFGITIKITGTISGGISGDFNEKRANIQDIDGDGLPDVITNVNSTVNANLNQVGKTHLLKKVNTPLGGSWTVEYARDGNTYDMPHSKWAMAKIQSNDGFTEDNTLKPDNTYTSIAYENPKYDRRERTFYGYEKVIIKEMETATSTVPYRTLVKSFHTDNYYLNGAEKGSALYSGNMEALLSEEKTTYNILGPAGGNTSMNQNASNNFGQSMENLDKSRLFVAVARTESTSYENGQSLTAIKDFTKYDSYGNLKKYIDYGEGPDDAFRTEIDYFPYVQNLPYSPGFASRVSVYKNSNNQLMRQRSTNYLNGNGKPTEITTRLNQDDISTVTLEYDNLGNLSQIRNLDNQNQSGDPFYTTIEYDSDLITYPTSVSNAFGEYSQTWYDLKFGTPRYTTDVNGQSMRTRIDAKGRTVEITGPNELALENGNGNPAASGTAWTIRMEYEPSFSAINPGINNPTNAQHHAITRHFDPEYATGLTTSNELLTVSIIDGFGQPLQVKKKHISEAGNRWMLSPLEKKDAFGRTLKSYQTGVQGTSFTLNVADKEYFYSGTLLIDPIEMTYDEKDRVKTVQQPATSGNASINYAIEAGMFVQQSTNELSQTENSFTDTRGRNRKTIQNSEITTTFVYNAINELKKVINNEGFETRYFYDLAGRKTEVQHPDRGVVTFKYDKASRMTEQSTSNLLLIGQKIKYSYDFGRLLKIEYPDVPQNNVFYTYGKLDSPLAVSEKAVGRLLEQKDATGVQVFGYGHMGEVTKNLRSVAVAGYQPYWFYTKWKYDSWNRIKEITYPDQELVKYHYNLAGSLKQISSQMSGTSLVQDVITAIQYNDFGERAMISHGNGTTTQYTYDVRRRLNTLKHEFNSFNIQKRYEYDQLSNITGIATDTPSSSLPGTGQIGGPVSHIYGYDTFNRITTATGTYTGPNDNTTPYLAQRYSLAMEYNTNHTIKTKTQSQWQGTAASYGASPANEVPVYKNSYKLDYSGYGTGAYVAGTNYGYQQPHAVRNIVESPTWTTASGDDPRIRTKEISYDANGNQTEIKEAVGEVKTSLRKNLWDAENRIRAVNLKPDDKSNHPIAIYTYNAGGERTVRYNYDHIDAFSNEHKVAQGLKDNVMLYPSGLLMGKAFHDRKTQPIDRIKYTKHYYAGSERISAKTGTMADLGMFPTDLLGQELPQLDVQAIKTLSLSTVTDAGTEIKAVHTIFEQPTPALDPIAGSDKISFRHTLPLDYYYFHPDHLGSSSYITNLAGTVSQHMEYLPFGETMVDEHLNSRNSPFKYNGKEFDEETGNYYYGARYYDPKWSIFVSVDPLAEKTMSSYGYCYNNPINLIDPTGMEAEATYGVNKNGDIKKLDDKKYFDKNGKEVDRIYSLDNNGKKTSNYAEVDTNTLNRVQSDSNSNGKYDYFYTKFSDRATKLFEFLSENTAVEWSLTNENNRDSWIATSHSTDSEYGGTAILGDLLNEGKGEGHFYKHSHGHPRNGGIPGYAGPSGFEKNDKKYGNGDKKVARVFGKDYPKETVTYSVYDVKTQNYIYYNATTRSAPIKKK